MYNWLDIVFGIILIITLIMGLVKGFIRQIIGIVAVIAGLILAVTYYSIVSEFFFRLIGHRIMSHFLGFLSIFLAVLFAGALLSHLLSKVMIGPFKFFDRVLGAALGLLKGILICAVLVFALLVFPVNKTVVKESQIAPFCLRVAQAMIYLIPQDLKVKFREKYREISEKVKRDGKKI